MKRSTKTLRLAAVAAAGALVLAACGSDSDGGDKGGDGGDKVAKGDGTLTVGTLLPSTGDLAFLGPPEFAGVDLAVKDINAAGGVLGKDVVQSKADSGDGTPKIAPGSVDKLLSAKSDVIIGAASSSVSLSVIDKIINAGVVEFSPANTSTAFDTYDDKGLYFRTAPSDVLQGNVLGNLVLKNGAKNVAILARQEAYGEALADNVEKTIKDQGGNVAAKVLYSVDATSYTSEIQKIKDAKPDAIVLIAFNETTKIIPGFESAGIGPKDVQTYFVDGNTADYSKDFPKGTLEGVQATYPGAELKDDFKARMLEVNPKLKDFTYGPESYDATIMSALAAEAAKNDSGEAIASELVNISRDGEKCTTFADCVKLIKEGKDIDYDGVSGPVDLNKTGSPSKATIGIFEYSADNTYKNTEYVTGVVE
ncbi:ABC transporter substrate-binding protein [Aeromicrobium terrae]|uniref:Amino acid ABC transporter substrate-binding protein n=1 Tax=Aeromicrobium terrae TaxID=2498846 RepID=A0A5C8NNW9_9ACTN|nr:ABC transporter substrate-binding protein [Aeromicrobium terrae]TXL62876.1 amino acid ABC transporter substrate-binding protein [Aeromicrobium terrae]